jgi:hypothetical protein
MLLTQERDDAYDPVAVAGDPPGARAEERPPIALVVPQLALQRRGEGVGGIGERHGTDVALHLPVVLAQPLDRITGRTRPLMRRAGRAASW